MRRYVVACSPSIALPEKERGSASAGAIVRDAYFAGAAPPEDSFCLTWVRMIGDTRPANLMCF
jgi:hypothetical protein